MTTLKYILKNIYISMRKSPVIFALFILCNFVSVLVIVFSHGVYQNYASKLVSNDSEWESRWFKSDEEPSISFGNITDTMNDESVINYRADGVSTLGEFRQVLDLLDEKTKSSFTGFYMIYNFKDTYNFKAETNENMTITSSDGDMGDDGNLLISRLEYDSSAHQYGLYSGFAENAGILEGRYLTPQEELEGKHVIYLPSGSDTSLIGKKVEFMGMQLEVIGVADPEVLGQYIVPFKLLPDDLTFDEVTIMADKPISTETYRKIKEAFTSVYGDRANFPKFETVDPTEQTFYASIMLISIALSVLAAINLAILFRYIMHTRRKTLAIFRLSGCTRIKIRIMYLAEVAGISIIIFGLCSALYHYIIMPKLTFAFPRIQDVYSLNTYLYLFAIFIIILLVAINIIFSLKVEKQPVDMLKKAGDK